MSLTLAFLALYVRTAAPSVLSGNSSEFQFAAPLLGVPHPTSYPLYMLLGKLATLALPFGDIARRVTLVSAACAALAVGLFFSLARRVTRSAGAALPAALALGLAPGLWNAATLAEVYALLMALLVGMWCVLAPTTDRRRPTADDRQPTIGGGVGVADVLVDDVGHANRAGGHRAGGHRAGDHRAGGHRGHALQGWRVRVGAVVAGLGCTHHGLFAIVGLPLFLGTVIWMLFRRAPNLARNTSRILDHGPRTTDHGPRTTDHGQLLIVGACFAAGLLPLLYPLVQYARYGPFDGMDYGLPRHYFWGAPASWGAALDLLAGGVVRRGIFRLPSLMEALEVLRMVGARLLFEFGPLGVPLGLLGCAVMPRRAAGAWLGAAWVFLATLAYLLLLGPAVTDAPVFTLPLLLPWALWIAAGIEAILSYLGRRYPPSSILHPPSSVVIVLLVAATLAWGYTRLPYSSKRQLWLFRRFGEATLERLPPGAAVITHWEQGTTLQYLILVERWRPDVWVDIVEPGDDEWGRRARRRYAGRPVFFVGKPPDVAGLPVEVVREDAYADLFQLRKQ